MTISSARKHVCSHGSLFEICIFNLVELYIPLEKNIRLGYYSL